MKRNSYSTALKLKIEIVWWLITAVIIILILTPIYTNIGDNYPFYLANILYVVVFITFTRYMFLLKFTLFSHNPWIKLFLFFLPIPLFIYFIDSMYDFQRFLDEEGLISIMDQLSADKQYNLAKYIQYEKLFFGTGAIITLILLPIRMMVSIWRVRNRGTV